MRMLMDEKICGFTLAEANAARKVVGKKQMSKIPELKKMVLEKAPNRNFGQYVWKYGLGPQMGWTKNLPLNTLPLISGVFKIFGQKFLNANGEF